MNTPISRNETTDVIAVHIATWFKSRSLSGIGALQYLVDASVHSDLLLNPKHL
jgi:hypothetical protein